MAEVAKGIIDIEINTGSAAAQLKALQQQINAFNIAINKGNAFQTKAASQYTSELKDITNSSRFFTAETVRMRTAAGALDDTLRKGKSTLGQYFSARLNKNSALFAETMALASERARTLQTQFVATTGASRGMQDALAIKPLAAFNNQAAIASQRTQILGQMFRQGTTQLINFGKNVQWAGRQLMVGFTIPLSIFATTAGRTFMDLEKQAVAFKKVYGDIFTTPAELNQNLDAVKELSKEFTKYGIAAKDTLSLAAQAAAAGRRGSDLTDAVTESTRLATLGQMDQNQALETTIALQSAFRLSGEELSDTINFLNMVENQTVVSLQDLAQAIPRVAPVIQGLGGDVKDMALFLAAMQEGGVSAAQGANALKSGLGSLINPTKAAKEMLAGFNINLDAIVSRNRGDLRGTVLDFATALQTLDEFSRQQALEQVFGKFQYARLGALFENVIRDGSQAQQVLQATAYSTEELARTADKELSVIEQSFGVQLTAAVEKLKLSLAPIGEIFVKLAIPIVNFATKIAEGFNNLPDFQKKFIAFATIITGLVIPAGTMFFGLLMNLTGQLAKLMQVAVTFAKGLITKGGVVGGIQAVSQSMKYMSINEIEASIAAKQLGSATTATNQAFRDQVVAAEGAQVAVNDLALTYQFLINRMAEAAGLSKVVLGTPGAAMKIAGKNPKKMARGGVVPGSGNSDTVPAMLMPGEFVVTKRATKSIGKQFLEKINGGEVPGLQNKSALDLFNAMGGRIRPIRKGTGRQLNAALRSGAPIRTTAAIAPGKPVITRNVTAGMPKVGTTVMSLMQKYLQQSSTTTRGQTLSYAQKLGAKVNVKGRGNYGILLSGSSNELMKKGRLSQDQLLGELRQPGSLFPVQKQVTNYFPSHRFNEKLFQDIYESEIRKLGTTGIRNNNFEKASRNALRKYLERSNIDRSGRKNFLRDILEKRNISAQSSRPDIIGMLEKNNIPYKISGGKNIYVTENGKTLNLGNLLGRELGTINPLDKSNVLNFKSLKPKGDKRVFAHANKGGMIGSQGLVPSLLTPGEFVVNPEAASQNRPFLDALNAGKVKNFQLGTPAGEYDAPAGPITKSQSRLTAVKNLGKGASGFAGAAALPALIAGQALAMSSNATAQKLGSFLNILTPVLFGFQILAPVVKGLATKFPILLTATGGWIAATVGIVAGIFALQKSITNLRNSGAKLNDAMYGSEEQLKRFSEATGKQTLRQKAIADAAARVSGATSTEAKQASSQFLSTDAGKKLIDDIKLAEKQGKNTVDALKNQLSRAMIAGLISKDEAKAIATDVGIALNNKNLAVGVTASIKELYDQDGNLILNNLLTLNAEINPVISEYSARKNAEALYEESNIFVKGMGRISSGFREGTIDGIAMNQQIKGLETGLSGTSDSVVMLRDAFDSGKISQDNFKLGLEELKKDSETIVNTTFKNLGISIKDLQEKFKTKLNGADLITIEEKDLNLVGKGFTQAEQIAIKSFVSLREDAKSILTDTLGKDSANSLMNTIVTTFAGGDAQKATDIFSNMISGTLSEGIIDSLLKVTYDPKTREYLNQLKAIASSTPQAPVIPGTTVTDGTEFTELPGPKSAFQQLKDTYDETMKYAAAVRSLGKETDKEAISLIGATNMAAMSNEERKKAIKLIKEQIAVQKIISFLLMSEEDQQISLLDVQAKVKDLAIKGKEQQIKAIEKLNEKDQERIETLNRQNEMDQRQTEIRNRGLEDLAKKEDAINSAYDARITALDGVQRANDRVAQQQQDRINLATALTSGDIAGAATAAAAMTQNFATGQLEDTRTALEAQQQREIDALTTSINGKMMTRAQIESEIDVINERIYQRGLSIQALEDSIYNRTLNEIKPLQEEINTITEERELINLRIDEIVLKITADEYNQMLAVKDTNRVLGTKRDLIKEIVAEYNKAIGLQAQLGTGVTANSGGLISRMMMGGKVKGYAMGGKITYKGSREPAPGMMMGGKVKKYAFGSMVPGLGNTDRVPALLTPGEFVVRKSATKANLPLLQAINDQVFPSNSLGSSSSSSEAVKTSITNVSPSTMYNNNYSVNVNVANTDASPNDIANIVVQKIRSINDRQVRGSRY